MIYPDVSVEDWCRRYSIETAEKPCLKCGELLHSTLPFAHRDWRGVQSITHSCGVQYDLVFIVSVNKNKRARWVEIYNWDEMEEKV